MLALIIGRRVSSATRAIRIIAAAVLSTLTLVQSARAENASVPSSQIVELTIDDPRPVWKAVELLKARYGFPITYEDPRLVFAGDLRDVAAEVRKDFHKYPPGRAPKMMGQVGGTLNLHVTAPSPMGVQDMVPVLNKLLEVHAVGDQGGRFRVLQTGNVLHVVPSSAKDSGGNWIEQTSLLDAKVSLVKEERSGLEMLDALCAAITNAERINVSVGLEPTNFLSRYRDTISAENEPARLVLLRILSGAGGMERNLTWSLLYDVPQRLYMLNIGVMPNRVDRAIAAPAAAVPRADQPQASTK